MTTYSSLFTQPVSQSEQAHPKQVPNHGGGYSFKISPEQQFLRFLILGSEGGTAYASPKKLTKDNATNAIAFMRANPEDSMGLLVSVSVSGRAHKNDAAIFALALAITLPETKQLAISSIPVVCRTGTHLFQFVTTLKALGVGWGRSLKRGVANWYTTKDTDQLIYQVTKYRQREGMSHRDVLRLCHAESGTLNPVFRWIVAGEDGCGTRNIGKRQYDKVLLDEKLFAFEELQNTYDSNLAVQLIQKYRFTHEMVPNHFLRNTEVWEALLEHIPYTALLRNIGRLGSIGMLYPFSPGAKIVSNMLSNRDALLASRVHPLSVYLALKTYSSGHGLKGDLSWNVNPKIVDVLENAFADSFDTVTPTNKNTMLAVDISGSMWSSHIANTKISAAEAAAVLVALAAKTEPNYLVGGFHSNWMPLEIQRDTPFRNVLKIMEKHSVPEWTNCSLPMNYALNNKIPVEVFQLYTDNDTNFGRIHPYVALEDFRSKMGIPAKLAVVAMTATECSIANPEDAGMLDFVGFDTATPSLIADFSQS